MWSEQFACMTTKTIAMSDMVSPMQLFVRFNSKEQYDMLDLTLILSYHTYT